MALHLVTGGAGFIGSHIASRLIQNGDQVKVLDNVSTGSLQNLKDFREDIEFIEGDIRDEDTLKRAFKGVDCVFHQAALPSVQRSVQFPVESAAVNAMGTLQILEASRYAGVRRVVYASSSSVYGNTPTLPKREDQPPNPLSPYAVSKLTGEQYCRIYYNLHGLEAVISTCSAPVKTPAPPMQPSSPVSFTRFQTRKVQSFTGMGNRRETSHSSRMRLMRTFWPQPQSVPLEGFSTWRAPKGHL
jgi:nucleoside-diphosphate-sugar epimerase